MAEPKSNQDYFKRSRTRDNFKFKTRYNYDVNKQGGSVERTAGSKSLTVSDLIDSQTFDSQKAMIFKSNLEDVPFRYGGPSYSSFNSKLDGNSQTSLRCTQSTPPQASIY